jgi:hypothetical protein
MTGTAVGDGDAAVSGGVNGAVNGTAAEIGTAVLSGTAVLHDTAVRRRSPMGTMIEGGRS